MRTLVTILAILIGLVVVWAVFVNTPAPVAPEQPAPVAETTTGVSTAATDQPAQPATLPGTPDTAPVSPPSTPSVTSHQYRALAASEARVPTLGSNRSDLGYLLKADLSGWGASILEVTLTRYHATPGGDKPYLIQTAWKNPDSSGFVFPFAARAIHIDGQRVELRVRWELVSPSAYRTVREAPPEEPGAPVFDRAEYRLVIVDQNDTPTVELRRVYVVEKDSYDIRCEQSFRNLTDRTLSVVWEQNTQTDMPSDDASYMGDMRKIAIGYFNPEYDPSRKHIFVDRTFNTRLEELQKLADNQPLWPEPNLSPKVEMAWIGSLNRYFAAVTHPVVAAKTEGSDPPLPAPLTQTFPTLSAEVPGHFSDRDHDSRLLITSLTSKPLTLAPGSAERLDLSLYTGPRKRDIFKQHPYDVLHFSKLILYSLGGPCTFCTFQWLAHFLLGLLEVIHFLLRDWGLAIIILVLIVRLILHPITKRAQINMTKMGKQMQTLQPEIEKLKKKYKDDQSTLNAEMMKLYREKGVNPANMLGCLPMFLQMPIWIALYAMLYYAIELRHQPAFYGVFQAISGGKWPFLADLSSADHFIPIFAEPRQINLYFIHPNFQSINIIPLLMAVVFYYQQKLTMPPAANEQIAQQQKIMKWMTLLFPFFLYSAPSGLTLYIMASTFAGIVDSLIVKRHIKREEEAGTLFKPKQPPKPGGFRDRISRMIEEKQRQLTEKQKHPPKKRRD